MTLRTIWNVDRRTDSEGRNPVAEQIVSLWPHDRGSARFFRSSANFLYRFSATGEPCFLRFADARERTREEIEGEMDLLLWLQDQGLRVTAPVPSTHGERVETVETEAGVFHALVFHALTGTQYGEIEEIDASRFEAWGSALGRLHAAIARYEGLALSTRPTWSDHLSSIAAAIPEGNEAVRAELEEVRKALQGLPTDGETYGLIHGDFELENLAWHDKVAIMDFDDCAHHFYVADIAFALRDLFEEGFTGDDPRFEAFLRGYSVHHPLDPRYARIPLLLRMVKLTMYAYIVQVLNFAEGSRPEWMARLERRFEEWVTAYTSSLPTASIPSQRAMSTDEERAE